MEANVNVNAKNAKYIRELGIVEGKLESPIDLDISRMTLINLAPLQWINYNVAPRKLKISNTGHTVILSAKWQVEQPYLVGGSLNGKYVFSQMHFHWGETEMRGSEHSADGASMPMELHVVHFKTRYSSQEEALRQVDGVIMVVYLFKLQAPPNYFLKDIVKSLSSIKTAHSSVRTVPVVLTNIFKPFTEDYFIYWGSIVTSHWTHRIMWLVCREPIGIAKEQTRYNDRPIMLWDFVFHLLKYRSCEKTNVFLRPLRYGVESLGIIFNLIIEAGNINRSVDILGKKVDFLTSRFESVRAKASSGHNSYAIFTIDSLFERGNFKLNDDIRVMTTNKLFREI